jgi:2-methylcitrate dehydratase PrpD
MADRPAAATQAVGLTRALARFVSRFEVSDVPAGAKPVVRSALLDSLGVGLLTSGHEIGHLVRATVLEENSGGASTVLGLPGTSSANLASFANAVLCHGLDYDDMGASAGHPSTFLVPASLALCEALDLDGSRFIAAYVVGYEVGSVLTSTIKIDKPFHRTVLLGSIASAAACAWLKQLSEQQVVAAIGLAASMGGGGLVRSFGTHLKPLQVGQAARVGSMAADMAANGWSGDDTILEGSNGFYKAYGAMDDSAYESALQPLGREYAVLSASAGSRVSSGGPRHKVWPCCGGTFGALVSLFDAFAGSPFPAGEDVTSVTILLPKDSEEGALFRRFPRTPLEGKFSLRYCVASAILRGDVTQDSFTAAAFLAVEQSGLLDRIMVNVAGKDMNGERDHVEMTVHLADGRSFAGNSRAQYQPNSFKSIEAKFLENTGDFLPEPRQREVIEAVACLEGSRMSTVMNLLQTPV